MYVLAGPNGAGKSTLYETRLKQIHPGVEFINADLLATAALGRHAETREDAQLGQRLANERRATLLAARADFITESTFSHESKLELIRDAKAVGYRVQLYHVNVRSPDISVARVEGRVNSGGHDVPENKIRERYARNQPLIRQAAIEADSAYVFDNSRQDKPPRLAIGLDRGRVSMVGENVPSWAMKLYSAELQKYPKERLNPLAASFDQARKLVTAELGDGASTYISRSGGTYRGTIIGATSQHTLQQIGRTSVIAHITQRLGGELDLGTNVTVAYPGAEKGSRAVASIQIRGNEPGANQVQAAALRELPRDEALKREPGLKGAYGLIDAAMSAIPKADARTKQKVSHAMKERLAHYIERGVPLPARAKDKTVAEVPGKTPARSKPTGEDRER